MKKNKHRNETFLEDFKNALSTITIVVLVVIGIITVATIGWKILRVGVKTSIITWEIEKYSEDEKMQEDDPDFAKAANKELRSISRTKDPFVQWYLNLNSSIQAIILGIDVLAYALIGLLVIFTLLTRIRYSNEEKRGSPD